MCHVMMVILNTTIFYISLLLITVIASSTEEVSWEPAPRDILDASLLPYERCLLTLSPEDFIAKSIFSQPKCDKYIDEEFKKLPKRCWLAAKHQHQDDGLCVYPREVFINDMKRACRPLQSRDGIKNYWSNLPSYSRSYDSVKGSTNQVGSKKLGSPANVFYQTAKKLGFDIVAFAGDSMAVLFGQRLACASMRSNVSSVSVHQNFFSAKESGATVTVHDIGDDRGTIIHIAVYKLLSTIGTLTRPMRVKKGTVATVITTATTATTTATATASTSTGTRTTATGTSRVNDVVNVHTRRRLSSGKSQGKRHKAEAYFEGSHLKGIIQTCVKDCKDEECWDQVVANGSAHAFHLAQRNESCFQSYVKSSIKQRILHDFRGGKKWSRTLHLVVLPIIEKKDWEMEPFAQAIYSVALQIRSLGSKIIIISPFSQHFYGNKMGLYSSNASSSSSSSSSFSFSPSSSSSSISTSSASTPSSSMARNVHPPVCSAHPSRMIGREHPDVRNFFHEMHRIDPMWRSLIGYFDMFSLSAPWSDLHSEQKSTGWAVDCTHYIYTPLMFDRVWFELSSYLLKHQQKE